MTEETHDAAVSGPRGHRHVDRGVAGRGLGPAARHHLRDPGLRRSARAPTTGVPPAQIFIDAIGRTGGKLLLLIVIGAQLFCGMASVTANSRMIYAFSRDGALPGLGSGTGSTPGPGRPPTASGSPPVGAFVLGLPYLWNATAYAAVTSIAVIGLYIAYVMPTFLRLRQGDAFDRGPVAPRAGGAGRSASSRWPGSPSSPSCSCCRRSARSRSPLQLHPDRRAGRAGLRRHLVAGSARTWFTGPRCRARPRSCSGSSASWSRWRELPPGAAPCRGGRVSPRQGMLTVDQLRSEVDDGAIDTVLVAITDMQGRLQGKRLHARFFLDDGAARRHRGLQLPARRRRRHEHRRGLRDVVLGARLRRLRDAARPDHPAPGALARGHRDGPVRPGAVDGGTVAPSPRQILRARPARLRDRGWRPMVGTELEFLVFRDTYEERRASTTPT